MNNQTILTTTNVSIPRDWNFTTTNHSPFWGAGLAIEYAINDRLTVTTELMYNKLKYTKETGIAWGTTDPSQTTDQRSHMFVNETTTANIFDVPLMVHYRGLRSTGPFSKLFVSAGVTGRATSNIKSNIVTTNPDTSTVTSTVPVKP